MSFLHLLNCYLVYTKYLAKMNPLGHLSSYYLQRLLLRQLLILLLVCIASVCFSVDWKKYKEKQSKATLKWK